MSSGPVPDDVRRFVLTSVPSVPFAEAVLLLRRRSGEALNTDAVARALYTGERAAQEVLQQAEAAGALKRDADGYRFEPRDAALAEAWDRFAACYATHLIGVTQLIHGSSQKSAQLFADAFKLRREP
ncbi:MAG: hypothetical protein EOP39_09445 [Rubrivivax sp.]|nr:MAG: hypothetical protein EOP39_09445 [Rubrivivax sp.]